MLIIIIRQTKHTDTAEYRKSADMILHHPSLQKLSFVKQTLI